MTMTLAEFSKKCRGKKAYIEAVLNLSSIFQTNQ